MVLEDFFQRGGIEDVFSPLFQLFERGGLQPGLGVRARWAEAASEGAFEKRGFAFELAFELAVAGTRFMIQEARLGLVSSICRAYAA